MNQNNLKNEISIYIHIPFCEKKCTYCAFHSFCLPNEETQRENVVDEYVDALCEEISKRKNKSKVVKTIYIGGGTPSVLSENQIEKIVNSIHKNFCIDGYPEFTIEANPNSITDSKLQKWKGLGINRVSIGVQSLCDKSLREIGRLHTSKQAIESVKKTRKIFNNVSCDLIVGLQGQNGKQLVSFAKQLLELGVKHISCYLLEVYDNTQLGNMVKSGKYLPLTDEKTVESFDKLAKYLQDVGLNRYEISNFAFENFESQHNLCYWARDEYLGFGLGAHSFENGVRTENGSTFAKYYSGIRNDEYISKKEVIEEKIMLGLRCMLGVDIADLGEYNITKNPYFEEYVKNGILQFKDNDKNVVVLNPLFYHLSNTIISNLLP